jgi:anaerobic ribonucleoside-triphosphate reductase activating protein
LELITATKGEIVSLINVAAFRLGTKALGPGLRSVLWVQGCPFNCPGCFSVDWIPQTINELWETNELAKLLVCNDFEGLTISGGEPFAQAGALVDLIRIIRTLRPDYTFIVYTGFEIEKIRADKSSGDKVQLLNLIDVLIDGKYVQYRNDNKGLRGSSNQRVHLLSDRYKNFDFENSQRIQEYYLTDTNLQIVGLPDIHGGIFVKQDLDELIR